MLRRTLAIGSVGLAVVGGGLFVRAELAERAWEQRRKELLELAILPAAERPSWELQLEALCDRARGSPRFAELLDSPDRPRVADGSGEPRALAELERAWLARMWSELDGLDAVLAELRTRAVEELRWNGATPRLGVARELTSALCGRAWLALEQGDGAAAVLAWSDALRLARALEDSLIAGTLIRGASEDRVLASLRSGLRMGVSATLAQAELMPFCLDRGDVAARAERAIRGELSQLADPESLEAPDDPAQLLDWFQGVELALARARAPAAEALLWWEGREATSQTKRGWRVVSEHLHEQHVRGNVAATALAVAAHRERHAAFPVTLGELALAPALRLDPRSGTELPYALSGSQARVGPPTWSEVDETWEIPSLHVWILRRGPHGAGRGHCRRTTAQSSGRPGDDRARAGESLAWPASGVSTTNPEELPMALALSALALLGLAPTVLVQDVPSDWIERVRTTLAAAEYEFSAASPGLWSAPNRAQELRVGASAAGLTIFPRTADWTAADAPWQVRIATQSFGRLGAARALAAGECSAQGSRVTILRSALEERLENDAQGIEHGWTIRARPTGVEPLWIGLALEGDARVRFAADGLSATLVAPGGDVRLRYHRLAARDASGRALPARWSVGSDGPGIRVDDAGAAYPVTVLAVLTGTAWSAESDQAGARFGWSVASAGDVDADGHPDVLVGAIWYDAGEMNEGRVYLFPGTSSGPATSASWTADGNGVFAELGWSLSTAGDVNGDGYSDVIVGAPNLANGQTDEGAAFLWLGSRTGLAPAPAWSFEGNEVSAVLGVSVGAAGDVNGDGYSDVAVGAPRLDLGQADEGAVLVFHGSAGGLSASAATTLQANQASSRYGLWTFSAGDVNGDGFDDLAVGADEFDNGQSNEGRAFVYHGSAAGLATVPAWTVEPNQANALLGTSVGTAGDVNADGFDDLVVGAPGWSAGQAGEGRALLYLGSASGLATSAAWTFDANQASAALGTAVATAGDVDADGHSDVAVGAPGFDGRGLAAVFLGSASGLGTSPAFTSPGSQLGSRHGAAVATSGDVDADGFADLLVGSWGWDGPDADEGRALWLRGGPEDPDEVWNRTGGTAGAQLGTSVATGGDVNGDGYSDVLLGAPGAPGGGMAFLHLGSLDGPVTTAAWTATSPQSGAEFGAAVAFTGDINADGYDDAIIGAPLYDGGIQSGGVFVYLGSAAGLAATPVHTLFLVGTFGSMARFGAAVATAGDVDGDGFADVLVGAPDRGAGMVGQAYLYLGSRSGLVQPPVWTEAGGGFGDFGASLAGAGDMNADGFSDVVVGDPLPNASAGRVSLYRGGPEGLEGTPWWTFSGQIGEELGSRTSSAGDVNGDGFSDVLVGVPQESRALLFFGSSVLTGLAVPDWQFESPTGALGAVVSAGDMNGDGYSDVLLGQPLDQIGQTDEGIVRLFLGSASGPALTPDWIWEGNQAGANLGTSLAGAGDVNGDGFADLVVGGPGFTLPLAGEGGVIVFHGNGEGGASALAPRQLRPNGSAALGLLGRSSSQDLFLLALGLREEPVGLGWSSPGPHMAWLEWEVKPLGTPFDGIGVETSALGQPFGASLPLPTFEELAQRTGGHARPHVWRARIVTDHPLWPATPWVSRPGNALSEAKLRFAPTSIPAAPTPQSF